MEKSEVDGKDRLIARAASSFFGIMPLDVLAGREADSVRCHRRQGGWDQGSSRWVPFEKEEEKILSLCTGKKEDV